ncbi:MAG: hypothetical protein EPO67_04055 [Reyranella sp.]|nr:MAG: hypothetical protein EPO67_04055 [Reyranella sp.]
MALLASAAPAWSDDVPTAEDETLAYCLGVNRQLAERFRKMQLWGCGRGPDMQWCRDAKEAAPQAMRHREKLVIRFANTLAAKGLLDAERPEVRQKVNAAVDAGSADAQACFNDKGARDEAACERLQRCAAAEKLAG